MPKRIRTYKIGMCRVENCGVGPLTARGLCKRHYQRLYRNGSADDIDHRVRVVSEGNKYCAQCDKELPPSEFRHSSKGRPADYCMPCEKSYYAVRKAEKLSKGECLSCGRSAITGLKWCETCRKRSGQSRSTFAKRARTLLDSAKRRAKLQGVNCTIDMEWVISRITQRCELTGLPFDLEGKVDYFKQRFNPYSPSIDRRAWGDYSPENCRLILTALNIGINHWGEETYRNIAKAYLKNSRAKNDVMECLAPRTYDLALEGQEPQSSRIRRH